MRKFIFGFLMSCVGCSGFSYASEIEDSYFQSPQAMVDLVQKHSSSSWHHRGPRGHRGPKGHRGHRGKQGLSASSIADRAYLLAPNSEDPGPIVIDPPMVVPVNATDLGSSFFDVPSNGFVVPESGVYQINYFVKATLFQPAFVAMAKGSTDSSGLVMGIVIDGDLANPVGIRSLPLVDSSVPSTSVVWGTHEIFIRLSQNQRVQLAVLANPYEEQRLSDMQFVQTGDVDDEVAYLSLQKVGV